MGRLYQKKCLGLSWCGGWGRGERGEGGKKAGL